MSNGFSGDPDDYFQETRMSFGTTFEDLRKHLWRAVYGFLAAMVLSLPLGKYVLDGITAPVKQQLDRYYDRRMAKVLHEKKDQWIASIRATPFRKMCSSRPAARRR